MKHLVKALHLTVADSLPSMKQLNAMIKEELANAFENVVDDYELYSESIKAVEHERRDGFIPNTQGGWQAQAFTTGGSLIGSGNLPKNSNASAAIEEEYAYDEELAQETIWEENKEELEKAGIKNKSELTYKFLTDNGMDKLAEKYSETVDEYSSDESSGVMFGLGVFYYEPGRDSTTHSVYVYSEINWEAPYFRSGKGASVAPFEEDIEFENEEDLREPLRKALHQAAESISSSGSYAKPTD